MRSEPTNRTKGNEGEPIQKARMKEMLQATADTTEDHLTVEQWLAIRKEAGLRIDPKTAEVTWWYALVFDPYDVYPDPPVEYRQSGREYFARSPESDIWVWFGDLPTQTEKSLWEMHRSKLAFPAGLPLDELRKYELNEWDAARIAVSRGGAT